MRSAQVVDEDPSQLHQRAPALVPESRPGHDLDPASAPAVPGDYQSLPLLGVLDDFRRAGQIFPLDPRTSLARVRRRRLDQVGIGVEQADQGPFAGESATASSASSWVA